MSTSLEFDEMIIGGMGIERGAGTGAGWHDATSPSTALRNLITVAIAASWVLLLWSLQIVDVYDETTGLVLFRDPAQPLMNLLRVIWDQSIGFWRPIPTGVAAVVIRLAPTRDSAWIAMRWMNALAMLGALVLFQSTLLRIGVRSWGRHLALAAGLLLSGSGILAGSWYASLFDVSVVLLVAAALRLATGERPIPAGLLVGIAFFCKETAVLGVAFLLILPLLSKVSRRTALIATTISSALGAFYFLLRSQRISLGSSADTHQFLARDLWPTVLGLAQSFWTETMKGHGPSIVGLIILAATLVGLRAWSHRLVFAALFLMSVGLYWGMLAGYQNSTLITHLIFIGRLYLVPSGLALFLLVAHGHRVAVVAAVVGLLFGGFFTYRDYRAFQQAYAGIYALAADTPGSLDVHHPENPLNDPVRELRLGNFPGAEWRLDPESGALVRRRSAALPTETTARIPRH